MGVFDCEAVTAHKKPYDEFNGDARSRFPFRVGLSKDLQLAEQEQTLPAAFVAGAQVG